MTVEKLEELIPRFEQRDKLVPAKSDLRTLQQNPGRKYGGGGGGGAMVTYNGLSSPPGRGWGATRTTESTIIN